MKCLRLINVSDYIHAGSFRRSNSISQAPRYNYGVIENVDGSWSNGYLPTGGIAFLLNPVIEHLVKSHDDNEDEDIFIFALDSNNYIKSEIYSRVLKFESGYKANRKKSELDISIQRECVYDLLKTIHSNVVRVDGYEADDIIASYVLKYKEYFDHIYIYTVDKDLYCLVDDNVSILPVGSRGKVVTKQNFSSVVINDNKKPIPFNGILLDKLFHGDSSDNIPGIGFELSNKIKQFISVENYQYLINFDLLRTWVSTAVMDEPYVMGILDLLIPLKVDDEYLDIYEDPILLDKLCYVGYLVGNKYVKNKMLNEYDDVKKVLDYYTELYYERR